MGNLQRYVQLNADDAQCPTPTTTLLWLATFNLFTVIWGLILGPFSIRRHVSSLPTEDRHLSWVLRVAGSLLIQLAGTIGTAYLFRSDDKGASIPFLVMIWFARPLATSIVVWLTMINTDEYSPNTIEIVIVDTIYGLVSIWGFGLVARFTDSTHIPHFAQVARAGSALGLLAFIIIFPVAVVVAVWLLEADEVEVERQRLHFLLVAFAISLLRYLACWLLWGGLLSTSPQAFCPTIETMLKVMALWLCIPIVDQLWRGVTAGREIKELDAARGAGGT